jgi:hypothetical protein
MRRDQILLRRIRWLTAFFIAGLVVSGATAIPLWSEVNALMKIVAPEDDAAVFGQWLLRVHGALAQVHAQSPFLFYGTDWLAFGHFVIAFAFVGALRDPVRNRWLFDFGLIACGLVIPYAFVFGALRGISIGWRLIDCAFGVFGFIPLWLCRKWAIALERPGSR